MYKNLLVATDGSKLSEKAVVHAIGLAKKLGAKITAFYAAPDYPEPVYSEGIIYDMMSRKDYAKLAAEDVGKILGKIAKLAQTAGVQCEVRHALSRTPWEAILAAARKSKCDAIVMGSHGRGGLAALFLGSETQKVLAHSKLPVIVVR
ncbi:MAG: universal stress protein [Betaproteobacteria bacterium]